MSCLLKANIYSLRHHRFRLDLQLIDSQQRCSYSLKPLPAPHARRRARMGPRLQCLWQYARYLRYAISWWSSEIHERNYLVQGLQEARGPTWRLCHLPFVLWPCRSAQSKHEFHRRARLCELHGVWTLHYCWCVGRIPHFHRWPTSEIFVQ